jgi:hypothetical protein
MEKSTIYRSLTFDLQFSGTVNEMKWMLNYNIKSLFLAVDTGKNLFLMKTTRPMSNNSKSDELKIYALKAQKVLHIKDQGYPLNLP